MTTSGPPPSQPSDDELDYLLSAGRLGGSQRERIQSAVATSVRRGARRRLLAITLPAGLLGTAAVAASLLFVLRAPPERVEFQPKGGAGGAGAAGASVFFDVICLRATLGACPRRSILAFSVRNAAPWMYVTAYAEPAGGGDRIWYLRNERVGRPTDGIVGGAGRAGLLSKGVQIRDEHRPGRYRIEVLLTERPVADLSASSPSAQTAVVSRAAFDLTVPP